MADTLEVGIDVDPGASATKTAKLAEALESVSNGLADISRLSGGTSKQVDRMAAGYASVSQQARAAAASVREMGAAQRTLATQALTRRDNGLGQVLSNRAPQAGTNAFTREEETSLRVQREVIRLQSQEIDLRRQNLERARAVRLEVQKQNQEQREAMSKMNMPIAGKTARPTQQTSAFNQLPADFAVRDAERANTQAMLEGARARAQALQTEEEATYRLSNARYAMFAAGAAVVAGGTAMIMGNVAVVQAANEYETAMAQIERTSMVTGAQLESLRQQFGDLAGSIPTSFGELAEIGTLAGQLNIEAGNIANFTENVAQFGMTTNVTAEASATAFGRLDALIPGINGNFEALGSSILQTGINSVATEQDIVSVSTQIAAVAGQAGFAADEVIGFASAMASMGIRPELARGALTRVFGVVSDAIAKGGAELEEFARVSGMTAESFATAWRDDTAGTFRDLLVDIDGLRASGEDVYQVFQRLGVINSRDIDVVARMSQNYDILDTSLREAATGYEQQTLLGEAAAIQSATLASRIQMMVNALQAMFAEIGRGAAGPLGFLVDSIKNFAEIIRRAFTDNAAFQWFATLAGAVTLLGGGLAVGAGTLALFSGSILAGRGALTTFRAEIAKAKVNILEETAATNANAGAKLRAKLASDGFSGSLARLSISARASAAAMTGSSASAAGFGGKLSAVGGFLMGPWGIALTAAAAGVAALSQAVVESQAELDVYAQALESTAVAADLVAAANEGWDGFYNENDFDLEANRGQIEELIVSWGNYRDVINGTASEYGTFSASVAQNAPQFGSAMAQIGANLAEIAATDPSAASQGFLRLAEDLDISRSSTIELLQNMDGFRDAMLSAVGAAAGWTAAQREAATDADILRGMQQYLTEQTDETAAALYYGADAAADLGDAMGNAATDANDLNNQIAGEFAIPNALNAAAEAAYNMGQALAESGSAGFSILDASGQGAMSNLMSTVSAAIIAGQTMGLSAAESVGAVFTMLQQQGVNTAQLLSSLSGMGVRNIGGVGISQIRDQMKIASPAVQSFGRLLNTAGSAGMSAGKGMGQAAKGARDTGKAAREAAPEVRTLVDYANDLSGVFKRAFDIQFGGQQSMDQVTTMWQDIRKGATDARGAIADANRSIRETQATIRGLVADRSILTYFRNMAIAYGDTLRADELGGQIGELNSKIAGERAKAAESATKVAEAQATLDRGLRGNSASAIENRETILRLVSGYQDYIQSLAASGASQATLDAESKRLKAEFIQQATQLGYNRNELGRYAKSFDYVRAAINRVPRNITVRANTNPASQALAEFAAKEKSRASREGDSAGRNFGRNFGSGVRSQYPQFGGIAADLANMFGNAFERQMARNPIAINGYLLEGQQVYRVPGTSLRMFSKGGYTGNRGVNEVAGITHGREFVINAADTARLGLPFLNALNSGGNPMPGATTSAPVNSGGGSRIMVVELSSYDRQLLMESGHVEVRIGDRDIAQSNGRSNMNRASRGSN